METSRALPEPAYTPPAPAAPSAGASRLGVPFPVGGAQRGSLVQGLRKTIRKYFNF